MTKTRNTKSALMSSVVALFLCFSMLLGTTYAWFTDSVTSGGNVIQAGTLDVELYQWTAVNASTEITDSSDPIFGAGTSANDNTAATLWEPGKTQTVYLSIKNAGSLDLKYMVALEVYDVDKDIIKVLEYAIAPNAKYGDVSSWAGSGIKVNEGTNIAKVGTVDSKDVVLESGEEHFFALSVHMLEEAGNEYQDASVKFDIKVLATQLDSEEDSFGKDYDKDATYPFISVSEKVNVDTTTGALLNTTGITLTTTDNENNKVATLDVPYGVVLGSGVTDVTLNHSEPKIEDNSIVFDTFELVDKNTGEEIDLQNNNNSTPIVVTLTLPDGHGLSGDVIIYHDGVAIASATVNGNTVEYQTTHFCKIEVVSGCFVKNADELNTAIQAGETTIVLGAGNYKLPNVKNKDLTLVGVGPETVVDYSHMGNYQEVSGSSFVFKNMTVVCAEKGYPYPGLQHTTSVRYENCYITGTVNLFSDAIFKDCTFNSLNAEHNVVTYGSDNVVFENCKFTYADRSINCYAENASARNVKVTFTDCEFTKVAGKATTGAIETNSSLMNSLTLTINNCTVNEGDLWWVSSYDSKKGANTLAIVDGIAFVASSKSLQAAINSGVSEIVLMEGEYTADLYVVPANRNLKITGQGTGTKLSFSNQQVRLALFDSLTIENCTIEKMATKNWGHLVFGSSEEAGGVYTLSNCTFEGIGTQGIYINQKVEATFNIENCTFNGDFGGEGAITIQNNDGVNITVDVTDCAFNDIPSTSHEICVLYAYDGWTLDAEGVNAYWKANN